MWRKKLYRGSWYAVTREGGATKRVALRTKDSEEADRALQDFLKAQDTPNELVSEILDAWLKDKDLKSMKTAEFAIKAVMPYFGHLRPDQVDRPKCRDYKAFRMARGRKAGTVTRELQVLRAALRWHDKNTPAVIELPSAAPPKDRHLTRKEYDKLLSAAVSPHIRLFIILALSTAARTSALLELTWDRVDFERRQIQLSKFEDAENKRRALVPMTQRAYEALQTHYKARTTEYVIEYGGGPVGSILAAFKRTAVKAGLSDVTPHVLRHSSAVWLAEAGVPMSEISQYLGHSNSRITESTYARYSPEYLKKAANALEVM